MIANTIQDFFILMMSKKILIMIMLNDCQQNARSFDRDDEENDLNHEYA